LQLRKVDLSYPWPESFQAFYDEYLKRVAAWNSKPENDHLTPLTVKTVGMPSEVDLH